jgi:outer membrane protein
MTFKPARLALVLLAAALAGTVAAPALAQQPPKIAVIDTEQILLNSETGKKALEELQTLKEQKEKEGKSLQDEVTSLQNRLAEGRLSLADDKLSELQQQLEEKSIALKRFGDDATRVLNKKRDDVLAAIDKKVMPVIAQVGKDEGYTVIFRKFESGLIYADEGVDITAEVIKRIDAANGAAGN